MSFQDVAFLPSRVSFFITFLKGCGRGESLGTTTLVSKGMLTVIYFGSTKPLVASVEFIGDHRTATKMR